MHVGGEGEGFVPGIGNERIVIQGPPLTNPRHVRVTSAFC